MHYLSNYRSSFVPFGMFNIRGFPGYIKIMQRRQLRLNISARSHFACACENNTLCAGAELRVHFVSLFLRRRVAGGANLVFGNAALCKLLLEVIVHGEFPIIGINGDIAKDSLHSLLSGGAVIYLHDFVNAEIYLAVGIVFSVWYYTLFSSPSRKTDGHEKWVDFVLKFCYVDCVAKLLYQLLKPNTKAGARKIATISAKQKSRTYTALRERRSAYSL